MNNYDTTAFRSGLDELGITLTDEQIDKFLLYYEMLVEKNKVMNLTAITEYEDVITKHFLDSLSIIKAMDLSKVKNLIDVGTGAGFPGVPIAIAFPNVQITLLDSLRKRVNFLEEVKAALKLDNVSCFQGRAEDFGRDPKYRGKYEIVVSRAVANLSPLTEYDLPFAAIGGAFVAYKSGNVDEELETAGKAISTIGGKAEAPVRFNLAGTDMERTLVTIRKIKNTPKTYPRKAGTPVKQPL
ncbi:MAG: 16S rRNA (guanine(527)-N(7))-methyltransferase RsmG [Eubacterium sp.]|nr:16S rRNA (guanine(527)-N(7))-methyltransferase RsmG [Eubacterium sp.]